MEECSGGSLSHKPPLSIIEEPYHVENDLPLGRPWHLKSYPDVIRNSALADLNRNTRHMQFLLDRLPQNFNPGMIVLLTRESVDLRAEPITKTLYTPPDDVGALNREPRVHIHRR